MIKSGFSGSYRSQGYKDQGDIFSSENENDKAGDQVKKWGSTPIYCEDQRNARLVKTRRGEEGRCQNNRG